MRADFGTDCQAGSTDDFEVGDADEVEQLFQVTHLHRIHRRIRVAATAGPIAEPEDLAKIPVMGFGSADRKLRWSLVGANGEKRDMTLTARLTPALTKWSMPAGTLQAVYVSRIGYRCRERDDQAGLRDGDQAASSILFATAGPQCANSCRSTSAGSLIVRTAV